MKLFLFLMFSLFASDSAQAQELLKKKRSAADKRARVAQRYEYDCKGSSCSVKLVLFKDHTFKYSLNSFTRNVFSSGRWVMRKDTLSLKSFIQSDDVPVKLMYSNDTSGMVNGFRISVVQNAKGEYMTDGFVHINSDSVRCLPMMGNCLGEYNQIDSVKVVFENGLSSRWIRVVRKDYQQIIPVAQVDFLISGYTALDRQYKISKSSLILLLER